MFGRMAETGDDAPVTPADLHRFAVVQAAIGLRHGRHHGGVIVLARLQRFQ